MELCSHKSLKPIILKLYIRLGSTYKSLKPPCALISYLNIIVLKAMLRLHDYYTKQMQRSQTKYITWLHTQFIL
jgi:hypothetical protein